MVSNPNPLQPLIVRLSREIELAATAKQWSTLKTLDGHVRKLLTQHPQCLNDVALRQDIATLRATLQRAQQQLAAALSTMKLELEARQSQQERAKAYQMTDSMESLW
ncbi:hypothetical protein HGP28_12525 [Vibrio sp. SM6]|uniref:LafD n=1 Tax=Vibrio agarilyticus TaxID=2726741 RepID=A0A7X8YH47_9VIBR|nr:hypothetical protein [Vibrio agarilyticus]NLS13718.1 hypothetical protein [Vibrio agarilyticus]